MGQVRGAAIIDDEASGETSLKLGFPLSRGSARLAPAALTNDKPTVKSSGQKLSMRGLLHVLWDRAELTHWHPKMAGKRSWFVVRRALLEAAGSSLQAASRVAEQALSGMPSVSGSSVSAPGRPPLPIPISSSAMQRATEHRKPDSRTSIITSPPFMKPAILQA